MTDEKKDSTGTGVQIPGGYLVSIVITCNKATSASNNAHLQVSGGGSGYWSHFQKPATTRD